MSRNIGHVLFRKDGEIRHMIYNGTSEQCYPVLYDSLESATDAFLDGSFDKEIPSCECGGGEPVIVIPYDVGPVEPERTIHWDGTACRRCRCILLGLQGPSQESW